MIFLLAVLEGLALLLPVKFMINIILIVLHVVNLMPSTHCIANSANLALVAKLAIPARPIV